MRAPSLPVGISFFFLGSATHKQTEQRQEYLNGKIVCDGQMKHLKIQHFLCKFYFRSSPSSFFFHFYADISVFVFKTAKELFTAVNKGCVHLVTAPNSTSSMKMKSLHPISPLHFPIFQYSPLSEGILMQPNISREFLFFVFVFCALFNTYRTFFSLLLPVLIIPLKLFLFFLPLLCYLYFVLLQQKTVLLLFMRSLSLSFSLSFILFFTLSFFLTFFLLFIFPPFLFFVFNPSILFYSLILVSKHTFVL